MSHASPHSQEAGQARATLIFAVIAVVLLVAAGIGIYFAKQRSTTLSEGSAKKPEVAVTTPKSPETKSDTTDTTQNKTKQNQPSPQQQTTPPTTTTPAPAIPTTPPSQNLPSTGPSDTLATVLALFVVTFSAVAYLQSRKALATARP